MHGVPTRPALLFRRLLPDRDTVRRSFPLRVPYYASGTTNKILNEPCPGFLGHHAAKYSRRRHTKHAQEKKVTNTRMNDGCNDYI